MDCPACGAFNSRLAEVCEDCAAPLDHTETTKQRKRRERAQERRRERRRQDKRRAQRLWASIALGVAVSVGPILYGLSRYALYSAVAGLGLGGGASLGFLLYGLVGLVCVLVLDTKAKQGSSAAWGTFVVLSLVGVLCFWASIPRGGLGLTPFASLVALLIAAGLLNASLQP